MASARAIFQAHVDGVMPESIPLDLQWTCPSGVFQYDQQLFASGNTIVTPPSGTTLILIVPPAASAVTLLLKKVAGDTGYPLSAIAPNVVTWSAIPGTTFVLNCSNTVTLTLVYLG